MENFSLTIHDQINEHVNFGSKNVGSNLYESVNLLSIHNDTLSQDIKVCSIFDKNTLYLSIQETFWILKNIEGTLIQYTTSFSAYVDTFQIINDYLLIGLSNGELILLNISTKDKYTCIPKEDCMMESNYFIGIYPEAEDSQVFLVLTQKGLFYRVEFDESNNKLESELLIDLLHQISVSSYANGRLLAIGMNCILFDIYEKCTFAINLKNEKKFKNLYYCDGDTFIGLQSNNKLAIICTSTLKIQDLPLNKLDTFIFYYHQMKSYLYYIVQETQMVRMLDYNADKSVFELKTENFFQLVYTTGEDEGQIYLTREEGYLSVHLIRETAPTVRLQRLISKSQLKEAEEFAKEYNLSKMDINKAKVCMYLAKLACSSDDIDAMIAFMARIDDIKFNFNSCLDVTCEEVESLEKILNYAGALELQGIESNLRMNDILTRFDMFKTLMRCEDLEMTVSGWTQFVNCDMLDYFTNALCANHLESAILIFSRLSADSLKTMKFESVLQCLNNLSLDSYTAFMYTMIPKSLHSVPDSLSIFINHIRSKIFSMEKNKRVEEYPEKAITFVEEMLTILHGQSSINLDISSDEQQIEILVNISKCLQTILQLKNNYNIFLPLKDCIDGPGAILQALLCSKDLNCIEEFLIHFMTSNGIDADEILSQKMYELINKRNETYWIAVVPSMWRCIVSIATRLDLLLFILKSALKPWGPGIRDMLSDALKLTHPLVKKIQHEVEREPQYIVLGRKEYNLSHEFFHCITRDRFIIQRIIHCNLPTLIEDVHTLCITNKDREIANLLMLRSFIDKGDFDMVYKLVIKNTADEVWDVDFLNNYYKRLVVDKPELGKNFLSCLNYINAKGNLMAPQYSSLLEHRVMQVVPPDFRTHEIFDMLKCPTKRQEVLRLVANDLSVDINNFDNLLRQIHIYSKAFSVQPEKILLLICEYDRDFDFLFKAAEHIHEISEDIEVMCLMATLILKRVGTNNTDLYGTFLNDTLQSDDDGKPLDETLLLKCLSMARCIAQKAYSLSDHSLTVNRVYNWTMVTDCLTQERKELLVSPEHFPMHGNDTNIWTINAIRNVFVMYCNYLKRNLKSQNSEYITYTFEFEKEEDPLEYHGTSRADFSKAVLMSLQQNMMAAFREHNEWTIYKLLVLLQSELLTWEQPEVSHAVITFKNKCNSSLLTRVFSAKVIDPNTALLLLLTYPLAKSVKVINDAIVKYKSNISKFEDIVKLGTCLTSKYKKSSINIFEPFMLAVKWWKLIDTSSFTFKNFCTMSSNDLIKTLIQQNLLTLSQLTEFCADYKFETEAYYLLYLNNILSTWKPEYEVHVDTLGSRTLIFKLQTQDLITKCMSIVELINKPDAVLKCINSLWNSTNFYYYEVYIAILTIGNNLNDVQHIHFQIILQFLISYQRSNKPCPVETEQWFSRFMYNEPLDSLSEWRYPFSQTLFLPDIWKLLRYEINLQNYEKWFVLADTLKYLNVNEICSYVVKDIIFDNCSKDDGAETGYYLQAKFEHLFEKIDKCLCYITDPLMAASVACDLSTKTPEGADQVIASKLAFKYAKKCKKSMETEGANMFNIIHKMYYHYSSKHILHLYNLATEEYVSLLDTPDELITALYKDERILNFGNAFMNQCPNINKAADELGELYQIDMGNKRLIMLDRWMNNKLKNSDDPNQSILLRPEIDDEVDENKDCIQRAAYMCSWGDQVYWRNYLYDCFLENAGQYLLQARTFKTFCMITSPEEVAARCDCSYARALETNEELFLLHHLNTLGYSLDLERLVAIDKKRLIHKLSKNMTNPLTVKTLIAVCNIYHIYDMDVWEKILPGLIHLHMVTEIKSCLTKIRQGKITLSNSYYIKAWQKVIDLTFKKFEAYDKPDLHKAIKEQIHYIQSSPVLNKLNLRKTQSVCLKLKQYEYATLLLQYISEPALTECWNELLRHRNREQLITGLHTLSGFTGLHYVSKLLTEM